MVSVAGVVVLLKLAVKTPAGLPVKPLPAAVGATEMFTVFCGVEKAVIVEIAKVVETGVVEPTSAEMTCVVFGFTMSTGSVVANRVTTTGIAGAVEP